MSALEGIQAKLDRAEERIKAVESQWADYIDSNPHAMFDEYRPHGKDRVVRIELTEPIPINLAILVGEALYHLQSSLDHLVGRMVERHGGVVQRHHAFPIERTPQSFKGRVLKRRRKDDGPGPLAGIPPESPDWAIIEDAQPYQNGDKELFVIRNFANIDKHRALHPAAAFPTDLANVRDLFGVPDGYELVEFDPLWTPGTVFEHNTQLARYRLDPPDPNAHMQVQRTVRLHAAFSEPDPEGPRFDDLIVYVRGIVERAEVLFA